MPLAHFWREMEQSAPCKMVTSLHYKLYYEAGFHGFHVRWCVGVRERACAHVRVCGVVCGHHCHSVSGKECEESPLLTPSACLPPLLLLPPPP